MKLSKFAETQVRNELETYCRACKLPECKCPLTGWKSMNSTELIHAVFSTCYQTCDEFYPTCQNRSCRLLPPQRIVIRDIQSRRP